LGLFSTWGIAGLYSEIYEILKEKQDIYDNQNSILSEPISSDNLRSMKIIGENIDFDLGSRK